MSYNTQLSLSNTIADAPPPPLQILAQPIVASFLFNTLYKFPMIRAPDIPIGCPRLTAPPNTLTLSLSRSSIIMFAKATTEKAFDREG